MEQFYKILKKQAFIVRLLGGLGLIVVGVLVGSQPRKALIGYYTAKTSVFDVDAYDLKEDEWYTCDNNILLGAYADDDDGSYYITITNDNRLIGFYVSKANVNDADEIMLACWDYMNDEAETWPDKYLSGAGYIEDMPSDEKQYFEQWFEDEGMSDEYLTYKTFHLLTPGEQFTFDLPTLLFALAWIVAGVVLVITFFAGSHKKKIKKLMTQKNVSEDMLAADMQYATKFKRNKYIGKKYSLFLDSPKQLIVHDMLVWVYLKVITTRHWYGFIPTGTTKSYELVFVDRNKRQDTVMADNEAQAQEIINEIMRRAPHIFCGFSDELKNAFDQDFRGMVARVDEDKLHFDGGVEQFPSEEEQEMKE